MSHTSSESTSLSDFVRARMTGNVPIFGGDMRTGARQFGSAVGNSVKQTDVLGTIDLLSMQLRGMVGSLPKQQPKQSSFVDIGMYDNSQVEMSEALIMDDEKIRLLLSASEVDPVDVSRYVQLIRVAQDGMRKKAIAQQQHALRKQARVTYDTALPFNQIDDLPDDDLQKLLNLCGHKLKNPSNYRLFSMAVTHDSVTSGRETNRVLAHIGDSVAKALVGVHALRTGVSVSELSDIIQSSQNNVAWRDAGINLGLDSVVRCGSNVDPKSKSVLSTAFEAVLGAIFVDGGIPALQESNRHMHWYDDGATPRLSSEMFVDATETYDSPIDNRQRDALTGLD